MPKPSILNARRMLNPLNAPARLPCGHRMAETVASSGRPSAKKSYAHHASPTNIHFPKASLRTGNADERHISLVSARQYNGTFESRRSEATAENITVPFSGTNNIEPQPTGCESNANDRLPNFSDSQRLQLSWTVVNRFLRLIGQPPRLEIATRPPPLLLLQIE